MVRRRALHAAALVAVVAALLGLAAASVARSSRPSARAFGLLPAAGQPAPKLDPTVPVVYHGGPVMRDVEVHTVFWSPPGTGFDGSPSESVPGYRALIERFLGDIAAASGTPGSVFSVLPQFSDTTGPGEYRIHFDPGRDTLEVHDALPAQTSGCASPAGIISCVTDAQVRRELDHVIAATAPRARGLSDVWAVLLPPGVDECLSATSCGSNAFGGYHSLMRTGAGLTVYAPVPSPLIELTPSPGSDPQGNPEAEVAINTLAHEVVEAITDPTGTGWMDPNGLEVGDKCENGPQYGAPLGYASNGAPFNQLINGDRWLLQAMWSGHRSGCVQHGDAIATRTVLPRVALTQGSSTVTGASGTARRGVTVTVALLRAGDLVAVGRTRTRADGVWRVGLAGAGGAPHAPGDDRDVILVEYGRGGPPAETILTGNGGNPFTAAGWTGWFDLDHGVAVRRRGTGGSVLIAPCAQTGELRVAAGGVARSATTACATDTDAAIVTFARLTDAAAVRVASEDNRAVAATDRAGALVRLTVDAGEPGSVAHTDNPLIPFVPSGWPTCTADLALGRVACGGLVPGAPYRLFRRRRGFHRAAVAARAADDGIARFAGLSGRTPVRGGDLLTLINRAGRMISALHVARLRAAIDGERAFLAGGTCSPGLYYGPGLGAPPHATPAVTAGAAGEGIACPAGGDATGLPASAIEQLDDRSGGTTRTEVPELTDVAPGVDETVRGAVRLLAGAGYRTSDGGVNRSRAQVAVTVTRAGTRRPVARVRNVNTAQGVVIGALAPGVYRARWTIHDAAGDTRTVMTRFIAG